MISLLLQLNTYKRNVKTNLLEDYDLQITHFIISTSPFLITLFANTLVTALSKSINTISFITYNTLLIKNFNHLIVPIKICCFNQFAILFDQNIFLNQIIILILYSFSYTRPKIWIRLRSTFLKESTSHLLRW